ncbi:MAG: hypothetical protein EKK39_09770 [Sphingobacteriales bacterium]|uniref:hypothetical protein n=1 Tax=Hydrotalea flava TaxID=714549 RepID=UPI00082FA7F2|nr:hypothetical protein [Hydrotalea flava]RTL50561.1 MAG: hypothetical protein EKK39_09770 [Sphingobacteriales bacterium]
MPNWGISIVLKNEHGFNTIVTPVIDEKNKTNALIFFYNYDREHIYFKIVDKNKEQLKLKKYGNREANYFSKSTLEGLFQSSDKNIKLLSNIENKLSINTNNIGNNHGLTISYICWDYTWAYSNSDGSVVVGVMPNVVISLP